MIHNYEVDITADGYGYLVVCHECGKDFDAKRFDVAFCSSTCRSRNHRKKAKRMKEFSEFERLVKVMCERLPTHGESPVSSMLSHAVMEIEYALSQVESDLE